jgi:putative membrane protein
MERALPRRFFAPQFGAEWSLRAAYGAIFALGAILFWLSESRPSQLPVWLPWDFSWLEYLATALTLFWYLRGLAATLPEERPSAWRSIAFLLGLAAIYGVLQTHFDYVAQHMFFLNRAQHVVMHHIGPFLIALGWPGATLKRGMPGWARQIAENRSIAAAIRVLQQPLLAAFLFVGLFYFWLIPAIHFRAMIDVRIYALMNWSMVLDGILFWALVLDPRPKPPARISYGARMALGLGVMFPQIILGAGITFSQHDIYPYYDLCGRILPSIGAVTDQHIGGIVIWIPPAMMSVISMLVVLNALRLHEESTEESTADSDDDSSSPLVAPAADEPNG